LRALGGGPIARWLISPNAVPRWGRVLAWGVALNVLGIGGPERAANRRADGLAAKPTLPLTPETALARTAGTSLGLPSGCVVLPLGDSLVSIFRTLGHAALPQKGGGGTGYSFSRLRPHGDSVASTGDASGTRRRGGDPRRLQRGAAPDMSASSEHRVPRPSRAQARGTADLFERLAARYDAWYDGPAGAAVFPAEVACLRPLLHGLPRPWAEIGVGSGRFAAAFGVDVGLDPAAAPLALARSRGIHTVRGAGEHLPFRPGVFGAVLIVVTVCFADDPAALLAEARRVVRQDGAVVLGEVFAESPWGRFYQHQAARGHPFYSAAHFLTRDQTLGLLAGAGLQLQAAQSTLYQPPTDSPQAESARDGETPAAGFVCWRTVPSRPSLSG